MKRKTKIALIIVGLLALTGIFYAANPRPFVTVNTPQSRPPHPPNHPAANPTPFATVPAPIGVAASKTDVFATEYCSQNIDTIDCLGNVSPLATIPGSGCGEKYLTIAPAQSANAGFTPRDIFIASGLNIYRLRPPNAPTLFVQIPGNTPDHTGITFDHVGTFGFNLIVTTENGVVWQVTCNPQNSCSTGNPPTTPIGRTGT